MLLRNLRINRCYNNNIFKYSLYNNKHKFHSNISLLSSSLDIKNIKKQSKLYADLSKMNLSALVLSTTFAGMWIAAPAIPSCTTIIYGLTGTVLTSASANASNQIKEIDLDAKMLRTRLRPLPSRRMSSNKATIFCLSSGILGTSILYFGVNPLTASLGVITALTYRFIYTPMKIRTTWNTAVGAIVGAIPPVMGWTAITNSLIGFEPAILFSLLFLWQIPHFMALAWRHRQDYERAGYWMLPRYDPSGYSTALTSLIASGCLFLLPFITTYWGMTTSMFLVDGTLLNTLLCYSAWKFFQKRSNENARKLFAVSTFYYLIPFMFCLFFHAYATEIMGNTVSELLIASKSDILTHNKARKACVHESLKVVSLCPVEQMDDKKKNINETINTNNSIDKLIIE